MQSINQQSALSSNKCRPGFHAQANVRFCTKLAAANLNAMLCMLWLIMLTCVRLIFAHDAQHRCTDLSNIYSSRVPLPLIRGLTYPAVEYPEVYR